MDTLPILDHGVLSRLRLVRSDDCAFSDDCSRPTRLQNKLTRFSESAIEALRTMRTALLLGQYRETAAIASRLALFATEMGALRVTQLCDLLQDIGPDERAYFAARLLSTLEVEVRCALAALSTHAE